MIRILLAMMIAGASALSADFNRDDSKAIVNDNATGLSWQDDADASSYTTTWQGAIDYCEALTLGGYDDWRLPNINELYTIVDRGRSDPAIAAVFVNTASSYYWSSTSYVSDPYNAWYVYFYYGRGNWNFKDNGSYVRCVRGGQ